MIDIAQLTLKDIGRWVWYTPGHGDKEKGKLKSWNSHFIVVVYKCAGEWERFRDFTGQSTNAGDLEFISHKSHCKASEGFVCACVSVPCVSVPFENLDENAEI